MDLSKRRAANFKEVMVDMYGIRYLALETIGYGETQLLDNGKLLKHTVLTVAFQ